MKTFVGVPFPKFEMGDHLMNTRNRTVLALILILILAGCGGSSPTPTPKPAPPPVTPSAVPTTIVVSPASATVAVAGTVQFDAVVYDQNSNPMTGLTLAWSATNSGIAAINSSGLATGMSAGTVTIQAGVQTSTGVTSPPQSVSASLTVTAAAPEFSISVTPPNVAVQVGNTLTLTATAIDATGNPLPTQPNFVWSCPSICSVIPSDSTAVITGVSIGLGSVSAESGGISGQANLQVIAALTPALTGAYTIAFGGAGFGFGTAQANLVSVPCTTPGFWFSNLGNSSCSVADNSTGMGSITNVNETSEYAYSPQVLAIANGIGDSPGTTDMQFELTEGGDGLDSLVVFGLVGYIPQNEWVGSWACAANNEGCPTVNNTQDTVTITPAAQ